MGKPVFDALLTEIVDHDHLYLDGTVTPNLTVNGQMEIADVGGTASIYFRAQGTTYYVVGTPIPSSGPVPFQLVGIFPPLTYPN